MFVVLVMVMVVVVVATVVVVTYRVCREFQYKVLYFGHARNCLSPLGATGGGGCGCGEGRASGGSGDGDVHSIPMVILAKREKFHGNRLGRGSSGED